MVGGHHSTRHCVQGHSIRKVENHRCRATRLNYRYTEPREGGDGSRRGSSVGECEKQESVEFLPH